MSENDYLSIDNYELKEDIGQGNFGKVKLGVFKKTGEKFAIKIIDKDKVKKKMKNILFKENEIITKFNHINIVYVFQIIEEEKNIYIIMEYCNKGELFDYIVAHKRLEEDEASIFFYQLINGVDYIHKKGVAHRDLKPENLLLTVDKVLKIIDFGLSHEYDENSLLKTKCGSPSYAAPEIIKGKLYDGFKTDIWCCGIILYAMLCGYLPFEGEDNRELFRSILECKPEYPSFLSKTSKKLIHNLLKINPDERLTIEEIKNNDFYLKGKELCKIDYKLVEDELEKRNTFYGNGYIKNKGISKTDNTKVEQEECKISDSNKRLNTINLLTEVNVNNKVAFNSFRQQLLKKNDNFTKKINNINSKIQKILEIDANESLDKKNENIINLKRIALFNKNNNIDNIMEKQSIYNQRLQNKNMGHFICLKKVNKNSINSIDKTAGNSYNKTKKFYTQFTSSSPVNKMQISPFLNDYNKNINYMNDYKNTETINFNNKYYNEISIINNNKNDIRNYTINQRNYEKSPISDNIFNTTNNNKNKNNIIVNSVENKNKIKNYINFKDINKNCEINSKNCVVNNINNIWKNNSEEKRKKFENYFPTLKNLQIISDKNNLQIQKLFNKYKNNNSKNDYIENNGIDEKELFENNHLIINKKNKINDIITLNNSENKDFNLEYKDNNNNNKLNYRSKSRDNANKNIKEKININRILPPLDIKMRQNH